MAEVELTEKEKEARERACFALDFIDMTKNLDSIEKLPPFVSMFKVGKITHSESERIGTRIIREIHLAGSKVFLDLKYHDTPQTVYGAGVVAAKSGVYMFNIHVAGGEKMCMQAVEGAEAGKLSGLERPKVIGVTVLTSLDDSDLETQGLGIKYDALVRRRTELARDWGLDGVVCAANKAGKLEKEFGSDFLYVTPGVKWGGKAGEGQKQLYTPGLAVRDCSNSILVLGSAIRKADDMRKAAREILQDMAQYL